MGVIRLFKGRGVSGQYVQACAAKADLPPMNAEAADLMENSRKDAVFQLLLRSNECMHVEC